LKRRELMLLLAEAAAVSPSSGYPQQPMQVIGWLSVGSAASDKGVRLPALHRGLNEAGYREGKNLMIEYRWAEGEYDRLPGLAADLVRKRHSHARCASSICRQGCNLGNSNRLQSRP
jgi:putative ABC transport system substrate-binding protein